METETARENRRGESETGTGKGIQTERYRDKERWSREKWRQIGH